MRIAVYLPMLAAALLGLAGPWLARRGQAPGTAGWALTICAGLAALTSVWSLVLLAGTLLDEAPPPGRRPAGLLPGPGPLADIIALVAVGWLVASVVRATRYLRAERGTYRWVSEVCRGRGDLVVLPDPVPTAFAAPVDGGRVVVSTGMLAALTPAQRRVLFAHERAHLRGGHHWHTRVARLAAAVNPVLAPLVRASAYLCERQADEAAARVVGDRRLAASALAQAALAASGSARPGPTAGPSPDRHRPGTLGYHDVGVRDRVAELLGPVAPLRSVSLGFALMTMLAAAICTVAADVDATGDFLRVAIPILASR